MAVIVQGCQGGNLGVQSLQFWKSKRKFRLNYREPIPRDEAIRRTIAWEREHPPDTISGSFDYPAEDAALNEMKAINI